MLSTLLTILTLAPQLALPDDATSELAAIEQRFGQEPRAASEAALDRLIARTPIERARLWRGNLALEDKQLDVAEKMFAAESGDPLAQRGLGDVAFARGKYLDAAAHYDAGIANASPPVAVELAAKSRSARRERTRHAIEVGCWIVCALAAAWFASRLRGRELAFPPELTFLVPVYALFGAAAWAHEPALRIAVAWIALGSLVGVALIFAAPRRPRTIADAVVALVMHGALVYIALHRSGLLDKIWKPSA